MFPQQKDGFQAPLKALKKGLEDFVSSNWITLILAAELKAYAHTWL